MLYAATAPFFLEKSMEKSREKGRAAVCERLRQDKPAWAAVRWCQRARAHHHSRCPLSFSLFASLRLLSITTFTRLFCKDPHVLLGISWLGLSLLCPCDFAGCHCPTCCGGEALRTVQHVVAVDTCSSFAHIPCAHFKLGFPCILWGCWSCVGRFPCVGLFPCVSLVEALFSRAFFNFAISFCIIMLPMDTSISRSESTSCRAIQRGVSCS